MLCKFYNYNSLSILNHSHVLLSLNRLLRRVSIYAKEIKDITIYDLFFQYGTF